MADGEPAYYRVNDSLSGASDACTKHLSGLFLLAALCPKTGGRVKEFLSRKYVVKLLPGFQFVMQRTQLPDFEVARARWSANHDLVAFLLTHQTAADGRRGRD